MLREIRVGGCPCWGDVRVGGCPSEGCLCWRMSALGDVRVGGMSMLGDVVQVYLHVMFLSAAIVTDVTAERFLPAMDHHMTVVVMFSFKAVVTHRTFKLVAT